jgi:hypothetical protein
MTGEMHSIKQNGHDSNDDHWPIHAAIAKATNGTLRPFDVYQGPYITDGKNRLWVTPNDEFPDYECHIYNETNEKLSEPFSYNDLDLIDLFVDQVIA